LKHFTHKLDSSTSEGKASGLTQYIQTMIKGQKKTELILYVVLWAVLFAAPVISMLVGDFFTGSSNRLAGEATVQVQGMTNPESSSYDWMGVLSAWSLLAMFCVTFFVHNFLIAPLLVYRNRKWGYGVGLFFLIVCFTLFQLYGRPHRPKPMGDKGKPRMEERMPLPAKTVSHGGNVSQSGNIPHAGNEGEMKPMMKPGKPDAMMEPDEMMGKPGDMGGKPDEMKGKPDEPGRGPKGLDGERGLKDHDHEPPLVFGGQDSVAFIIMALLLGLNIGTKYFFKSLDDRKRMKELERENLTNQLAYLKYQINPHFFMNTLNNIHALVDIDPEQAKYTIEVLSKMMRYVLYEDNKSMAPLQKELDFIANYIELMKIRYTDKVRLSLSLPTDAKVHHPKVQAEGQSVSTGIANIEVPSMLLITFVENAFKHGVSYQQASFIEVGVRVDEASHEIEFLCNNSRKPASEEKHGGVGLRNAQKRLNLIYGKEGYDLHIDSTEKEYRVLLRLPIHASIKE